MTRTIIHVDMDAFYASVEQRDEPAYRGKPVIVGADPKGGDGRGVVAACSYEARALGIHSAMPISRAYKLCPDGIFLRGSMGRYKGESMRIHAIFADYTDLIEPISLDEAFLDVTGSLLLHGDGPSIGRAIKGRILSEVGLICSVGVAPNKYVAKIGSDIDKPDGFVVIEPDEVESFLSTLPIKRLWGVGAKTANLLNGAGLMTLGDVARAPEGRLRRILGEHGEGLRDLALGIDHRPVVPYQDPKSIGAEVTFAEDTDDHEKIRATILSLSEKVGRQLRRKGFYCRGVMLKYRDEGFNTLTRQAGLDGHTDLATDIFKAATELLEKLGNRSGKVRLVGVTAIRLTRDTAPLMQPNLFSEPPSTKPGDLERSMDAIREKFGTDLIKRGSLLGKKGRER